MADQGYKYDAAGFLLPLIAFLLTQFFQQAAPPGLVVPEHPATDADFDRQRRTQQLVGIVTGG